MRTLLLAPVVVLLALPALACNKSSGDQPATDTPSPSAAPSAAPAPTTGVITALKNAVAPSAFEGEITVSSVQASRPAQTMTILIKGDKVRFNADKGAGGRAGSGIVDLKDKKMITMIDVQKKYVEMDLGGFNPAAAHGIPAQPTGSAPATPPKVDKTGKHETVAGHDCEDWNITSSSGKSVVCMASDVGAFDFASLTGAAFVPSFMQGGIFGGSVFPLKAVELDEAGKEKSRIEVTHIDRKPEDDSNFAPPAGYTKLDLAGMGGMGAMGFGAHGPHPTAP
jgi:hypothetical protein